MNKDIFMHQKTALTDGFNATVGGKPTIASPAELLISYQKLTILSRKRKIYFFKKASVDRTGFEPALSAGEADGLPLTYRPKFTEAAVLSDILKRKVKLC